MIKYDDTKFDGGIDDLDDIGISFDVLSQSPMGATLITLNDKDDNDHNDIDNEIDD